MSALDLLMILLGIVIVALFTWQRMLRALFFLVIIWASTLVAALAYQEAALRTKAITGANVPLAQGLFFIGIFMLVLVIGYILVAVAFPVTHLPRLGVLDYFMGMLIGVIAAALVATVLINGWGVMVNEVWKNRQAWAQWNAPFAISMLRPWTRQVMGLYRVLFLPFFRQLPLALYPL